MAYERSRVYYEYPRQYIVMLGKVIVNAMTTNAMNMKMLYSILILILSLYAVRMKCIIPMTASTAMKAKEMILFTDSME